MTIHLEEHLTFKKIFHAAYAPVLMMVFSSLYSIVDGLFVSNFAGADAFAGVNLVFPFIMVVGAVGFMIGTGGGALVSKNLGERNRERANQLFSFFIYFTIAIGILIGVASFFIVEPFVYWMASLSDSGVSQSTIDQAILYGRILVAGTVLMMLQYEFQSFFLTSEKPKLGFLVIAGAGITNIILDALFIGIFHWGVVGAAAATLIGQGFSSVFPIIYFATNKKSLLHLGQPVWDVRALGQAAWNGSSEFVSSISSSIVSACYNAQLLMLIGQNGVAAYGIVMYVSYVFMAIFIGYASSMAPFIGYQYGAKNPKELHNILMRSLVIIGIAGLTMFGLCQALAKPLSAALSSGSQELADIAENANRIFGFVYLSCGFSMFASSYFTALNNGTVSAIISFCRSAFEVLFVFLIPLWLGVNGVWSSACFAEIVSTLVTVFFFLLERKRYGY